MCMIFRGTTRLLIHYALPFKYKPKYNIVHFIDDNHFTTVFLNKALNIVFLNKAFNIVFLNKALNTMVFLGSPTS